MTYQKISGTLSANAHGSYSTQDALGDLLVTDVLHRNGQAQQTYLQEQVGTLNCMHDQQAVILRGGTNLWKITIAIMW